ncbi:Importin subunit alpha [Seminavis robusta]|uniref:Importin subunit alpha n=1 Tax=Seminavis robusta TaxID=568900 RepID=A0A9N8EEL8_9STRA|nr:Importin subunit alpha [Seminavis robusta]|eukprot:Sro1070_g237780.1 Importin subunit alpha (543) ;mRNA; f:22990-24968
MLAARANDRKQLFKKQNDLEHGRRRREETTTQLRKAKKEEQLMKRRQAAQPHALNATEDDKRVFTKADIPSLMNDFISAGSNMNDPKVFSAVQGFRRMLSVEDSPPVDEVLEAGALRFFVGLLDPSNVHTLVFEATWALTNIASTDKTQAVVDGGALPMLIQHLHHPVADVREQAAWCIGNIAGDSQELRDLVLGSGALVGLILNLKDPATASLLGNVTWAVSNLCRGKPSPQKHLIQPAVGPLAELLGRTVGPEVMVDAAWALSYLADGDNDRIDMVMETGVTEVLVQLLEKNHLALTTPVVRTLGNFVTGDDLQTQTVVEAGVIEPIVGLLNHPSKGIRKECCWLLSNIAAGTEDQIDMLVEVDRIFETMAHIAQNDRHEVRKEALWVIANVFTTGTEEQLRHVANHEGLKALADALSSMKDSKSLIVVMEALDKVFEVSARRDLNFTREFDEWGGIDALEELQSHSSEEVYEKAVELIEKYYGGDDEEDENVAPSQENGMFSFGTAKQLFPADGNADSDKYAPVFGQTQANSANNIRMF